MSNKMDWIQLVQIILVPTGLALVGYFYKTSTDLRGEMKVIGEDVNKWKLTVVEHYATKQELEKMESRIMGALDRLDVKLERVLNRFGAD
jgi:predicted membrane protein